MKPIGRKFADIVVRLVRLLVWLYYSTIRVSGRGRIPPDGPVLYVANHANSLIDPVIIGLTVKRRVRFLAKGPLFDTPLLGKLLEAFGMIPVFRSQDDRAQLKRNFESLEKAAQALAAGESVGIFPEGKSHDRRTLGSLFAGTSRIILQALEAGAEALQVVPIGINYDDKQLFRSAVWVQVGEPIKVRELVEAAGSAANARRQLTAEIEGRLKSVIIHLDDPQWEPFLEDLEILDPALEAVEEHRVFSMRQRKVVADSLNHFRRKESAKVSSAGRALAAHRLRLRKYGLQVRSEILRSPGPRRIAGLLWKSAKLMLGLVPVAAGTIQNALPFFMERGIVRLLPRSNQSTIALARLLVGVPLLLGWYAFVWWWMSHYFKPWVAWFWTITTPFAGLVALRFWRSLQAVASGWWAEFRMLFSRKALTDLRSMQDRIGRRIRRLSEAYSEHRPTIEAKRLSIYQRPWLRGAVLVGLLGTALGFVVVAGLRAGFRAQTLMALTAPAFDFSRLDARELEAELGDDEARLTGVITGLRELETNAKQLQDAFAAGRRSHSVDTDSDAVRKLIVTYQNCRRELFRFIWKYRSTETIPGARPQLRASLLGITAGCALYQTSLTFVTMFDADPDAKQTFNEADPFWGIEAGLYDNVRLNLRNHRNLDALAGASSLYQTKANAGEYAREGLIAAGPWKKFHEVIARTGEIKRGGSTLATWFREVASLKSEMVYSGETLVSTWVGNTRVREIPPKITKEHLEGMRGLLKPGDILVERQDWFLSRAVMPGFWAHAALYVGSAEELETMGLRHQPGIAEHWEEIRQRAADGHVANIVEAVPQGVRITTLEHCLGVADSAAILRPAGLSDSQIKLAIGRAFRHLGKPYDFEFDFATAGKLVCTELVYRAFAETPGFDLPLIELMGRVTFPPSELAEKFAREWNQPARQLKLVLFLDGQGGDRAIQRSEADFAGTARRNGFGLKQ